MHRTLTLTPTLMAVCLAALPSCGTVAETGRSQLLLFNEQQMTTMGLQAYEEACKGYRVITGTPDAIMVERIGQKIAKASGRNYAWQFRLLDAPDVVNAFCLPGGKVAVYTGILKVTQNEDGLAAVMGHEVAHATSNHGNERVSQGTAADILLTTAGEFVGRSDLSAEAKANVMIGLNAGANVGVLLPFSREHESEADKIGLLFLIRAGYDPEEAPRLWERMAKLGGGGTPEFLSTHPSSENRAAALRAWIPELRAQVERERGKQ